MAIVRQAIEESGVSTVVSNAELAENEVDLAVWSQDAEPLIKNPIVIELKMALRGKEHVKRTIMRLAKALDSTGTQVGLLIYADGRVPVDEDTVSDPRILVFSLEDFLSTLKQQGFADVLRREGHACPRGDGLGCQPTPRHGSTGSSRPRIRQRWPMPKERRSRS